MSPTNATYLSSLSACCALSRSAASAAVREDTSSRMASSSSWRALSRSCSVSHMSTRDTHDGSASSASRMHVCKGEREREEERKRGRENQRERERKRDHGTVMDEQKHERWCEQTGMHARSSMHVPGANFGAMPPDPPSPLPQQQSSPPFQC